MSRFKFILFFCIIFAACKDDTATTKAPVIDTAPATKTTADPKPLTKPSSILDTVSVSSIEELVENAKSNSVLVLKKGTYSLKKDFVYHVTKESRKIIDKNVVETRSIGGQLFLSGLTNFQIIGEKGAMIVSENPEAVPFFVISGKNLKFSNLTIKKNIAGNADLSYISNSQKVVIDRFNLEGGGTYGMNMNNVDDLKVNNTKISKCTTGIIRINNSRGILFVNSTFTNNVCTVPLINLYGSGSTVSFNNVIISDNKKNPNSSFTNSDRLFAIDGNSVQLDNCEIRNNVGYSKLGISQNLLTRSQVEGVSY